MAHRHQQTAERIKRQRQLHGETPMEVALAIGVSHRTYERWEAGTNEPRLSNIRALAEHWSLEVVDLRPDLEAESDQLTRIEEKLDNLIAQMEAGPGAGDEPPVLDAIERMPGDDESPPEGERETA